MAGVVELAASVYLNIHRLLTDSPYVRRVWNAHYNASFEEQEKLLADTRRIGCYRRAIAKYVKEGDVVVDLGTGTGILAFLAQAQEPAKTYAIDHSSVIECARTLAVHNGFTNIEFLKTTSKSFRPKERLDAIVHELTGSWVFNEHMVESVLELRDRALKKGGRILPNRFEVFFEPVQMKRYSAVPLIWDNNAHGVDLSSLREANARRPARVPMLQPHEVDILLAQPTPVVVFDLETMKDASELPGSWHQSKNATASGTLHGFVVYFKAYFDEEIVLDTTPQGPFECPAQRRLPLYRVKAQEIRQGDGIEVDVRSSDWSRPNTWHWDYSVRPQLSSRTT